MRWQIDTAYGDIPMHVHAQAVYKDVPSVFNVSSELCSLSVVAEVITLGDPVVVPSSISSPSNVSKGCMTASTDKYCS